MESELRHGRMAGDDSFGKRLGQRFDWVTLRQITERWR
jgi:hypothetical protein